jgi:hydroxymethylbilane synthase
VHSSTIRIGTRGSPLALAQAHEVRDRLATARGLAAGDFEIVVLRTSGDRIQDRPLAEAGGKGLFTKEIEEALLDRRVDLGVHSMKDVPTALSPGLAIAAMLPREDVRDAFLSLKAASLADLPAGATVGTSSLRRTAQVLNLRPDLNVVPFRGNVETRLRKLAEGQADATLLAAAGLRRLGMLDRIRSAIPVEVMLPAVAQGAIGIEVRADDTEARLLAGAVDDAATHLAVAAERAFLAKLEGSCRTPIAGLARLDAGRLILDGQILTPDGREALSASRTGRPEQALDLALAVADELLARAGPGFLAGRS